MRHQDKKKATKKGGQTPLGQLSGNGDRTEDLLQ